MANTTDIMITSLFDEHAIEYINEKTDLELKRISNAESSGGPKALSFEAFGTCQRCIGKKKIDELIKTFKSAPFCYPKYAILLIDDDNLEFNSVVRALDT